jgi:predicted HicB family RNase H-like nuclease
MTMKRTELEKRKGLKIVNELRRTGHAAPQSPGERRAQRALDRAAGLVPFAVKLPGELVRQLQEAAEARGMLLNELVDELLRTAMKKGNTR